MSQTSLAASLGSQQLTLAAQAASASSSSSSSSDSSSGSYSDSSSSSSSSYSALSLSAPLPPLLVRRPIKDIMRDCKSGIPSANAVAEQVGSRDARECERDTRADRDRETGRESREEGAE